MHSGRRLLAAVAHSLVFLALVITASAQSDEFTVVVLPDTQIYSRAYPHIFRAQTEWIARNHTSMNIRFVVGLGDVVDNGSSLTEYKNADAAVQVLDQAGVPYVLPIGNHDYDNNQPSGRAATLFNQFFGPARYAGAAHYQSSYPAGTNENFYSLFNVSGRQLLVLALEFNPRDSALQWANGVLAAHPSAEAIIVTHSYLFSDDSRVAKCDPDSAATYGLNADNDGEEMWDRLVKHHSNVTMVLSGHIKVGDGTGRLAQVAVNGNLVNQILADYQAYPEGGGGYLRIMRFQPSQNRVLVSTYSPHYNAYLTDGENQFALRYKNDLLGATGAGYAVGRVRAHDCTKLSGVSVSAAGTATQSDAEGLYRLAVPGPFTGTLSASRTGFIDLSQVVTVHSGYDSAHDFWLSASSSKGALRGRVIDAFDGGGVAGASVTLGSRTSTTDLAGYYGFDDVIAGNYTIAVNKSGWIPASAATIVYPGSTTTTDVAASRAGVIRGRVVDSGGAPVSDASITANGGVIATARTTVSDVNGDFSFGWIPVGAYELGATSGTATRAASTTVIAGATSTVNFAFSTKDSTSTGPAVTIHAPTNGSTIGSPVRVYATAVSGVEIRVMQVYVQGKKVVEVTGAVVDQLVPVPTGTDRRITVQAYDRAGNIFKSTIKVAVH